ncbi:MAG: hypothetical protein Q4C72_01435 [Eubacteriales bacterium]|nr:hypothetical protein [Eubacteriales bacterium]
MKRTIIGALLSAALLASSVLPAGAAADGSAPAPELTVKEMGLPSVERAVRENNPTVRALEKRAAGMDIGSDLMAEAMQQAQIIQEQVAAYQKMAGELEAKLDDPTLDESLRKTYEAQLQVLQSMIDSLMPSGGGGSSSGGSDQLSQLDDAVYQLRKTAGFTADQMSFGAQSMLLGIRTLQLSEQSLTRQIAALDRQLAVLERMRSLGTASQLTLDTARNGRDQLARAVDSLEIQAESMASSLALMCGYDAGTLVMPSALSRVYEGDLSKMSRDADREESLKNSFAIWQKRIDLQTAQNQYDKSITATGYAVKAAEDALAAERELVGAAFDNVFQTVKDAREALKAAETEKQQAELDFSTSALQYKRGMISQQAYLQAQDALAEAGLEVEKAQLALLSAYNTYEWAKRGVVSTPTA